MRLIDGDALMETIRAHDYPLRAHFNSTDNGMFTLGIQQAVDEQPTVDAVPVCRCEKCVYWDAGTRQHHKDDESEWDEAICDYFHEIGISQTVYTNANWFCADGEDGERKGGEE